MVDVESPIGKENWCFVILNLLNPCPNNYPRQEGYVFGCRLLRAPLPTASAASFGYHHLQFIQTFNPSANFF